MKSFTIQPAAMLLLLAILLPVPPTYADMEETVSLYGIEGGLSKLDYKYTSLSWEDIPGMLKAMNKSSQLLKTCSRGTWLLYNMPHLAVNITDDPFDMDGVAIFTSETEKCLEFTTEIPSWAPAGGPGSLQHVTSYHKRKGNTITFFQFERFQGKKMTVNKAIKLTDEPPTLHTYIKSLITVGKQDWSVVMNGVSGAVRLCFKPQSAMTLPVCYISHLIDNDKVVVGGVLQVYQGDHGIPCDAAQGDIIIDMKDCVEHDAGLVRGNATGPFGPPHQETNKTTECEDSEEILEDEHIQLIAARLNGTLGSGMWFKAIKDPKQIWKTELFDKSFQVMSKICPDSVISEEYLLIFASLYFFHMNKVWESGKFKGDPTSEVEWMEILHDMTQCVAIVLEGDYDGIASETSNEMKNYQSLDEVTEKLETRFGFKPDFDHVMEINWFMANLVSTICTKARKYDRNFLSRFLDLYHVLYFSPIEEQWKNPGKYQMTYKYLFGGYGMRKSLVKIALCTYNAMIYSGVTIPYKRPMDQPDTILLPKVESESETADNTNSQNQNQTPQS